MQWGWNLYSISGTHFKVGTLLLGDRKKKKSPGWQITISWSSSRRCKDSLHLESHRRWILDGGSDVHWTHRCWTHRCSTPVGPLLLGQQAWRVWAKLNWSSLVAASVSHYVTLSVNLSTSTLTSWRVWAACKWDICNQCLVWHHLAWQEQRGDVSPSRGEFVRTESRIVFWIRTCN